VKYLLVIWSLSDWEGKWFDKWFLMIEITVSLPGGPPMRRIDVHAIIVYFYLARRVTVIGFEVVTKMQVRRVRLCSIKCWYGALCIRMFIVYAVAAGGVVKSKKTFVSCLAMSQ
jgi:hypothetical protein